jgi:hypothetical protein
MRYFVISAAVAAITLVSLTPGGITAQGAPTSDPGVVLNIGGILALPTGDFRGQIDRAYGFTAGARVPVSHQGRVAIRLDCCPSQWEDQSVSRCHGEVASQDRARTH